MVRGAEIASDHSQVPMQLNRKSRVEIHKRIDENVMVRTVRIKDRGGIEV